MTAERVDFCTKMMDLFFSWLEDRESVEFMTATDAVMAYKRSCNNSTIPMYMPFRWVPVPKEMAFWKQVQEKRGYSGSIHKNAHIPDDRLYEYLTNVNDKGSINAMEAPPWLQSFFFYDGECQLAFDKPNVEPFVIFNYLNYEPPPGLDAMRERGGGPPGFFIEPEIPGAQVQITRKMDDQTLEIQIQVENPKNKVLPYGLFLWDDQNDILLSRGFPPEPSASCVTKIISHLGVFMRMNLEPGENTFRFC
jgi:hypothetical protein